MLKLGQKVMRILLDECLNQGKISIKFCSSEVILFSKKSDNTNIEDYYQYPFILLVQSIFKHNNESSNINTALLPACQTVKPQEGIYQYRLYLHCAHFDKEMYKYNVLIYLHRSPEGF